MKNKNMIKIEGILDRVEGDFAIIKYKDITINLPKELLPENYNEGMSLFISVNSDEKSEQEKEDYAKAILNEIINPVDEK